MEKKNVYMVLKFINQRNFLKVDNWCSCNFLQFTNCYMLLFLDLIRDK